LARNYGGALEYILEQDWTTGLRLIIKILDEKNKAIEENNRSESWQLYCSIYPHFTEKTFIPFSKFYIKPGSAVIRKTKEQIKAEVERDRIKYGWK